MTFTEVDTQPIKRDQWGRYRLPDPETGKEKSWTRVTTVSRTLADRFGLERWAQRNIVYGLGQRADLFARAAAAKKDDDATLTEIVDKATEAAAASSAAVMGSAVHQFTERVDRGEDLSIPEPMASDVRVYQTALRAAGLEIVPDWIERVICVADLGIAGTVDRLVIGRGEPKVGDVKTGKDVERYGMAEIPLQLALYAHASHWWDGQRWQSMEGITVDQRAAIVMHVPAGQGVCTIYEVDIAAGWEAVQLALDVRAWRTRKGLCVRLEGEPAAAEDGQPDRASTRSSGAGKGDKGSSPRPDDSPAPDPARFTWLQGRVDAIKTSTAIGDLTPKQRLAGLWSLKPEIPTFPRGGPRTDTEIDAIAGMCDLVEMEFELSFGASDPTLPKPTKANRKKGSGNA